MFTVGVSNKAGLEEIVYSDPVIIDTTSPEYILMYIFRCGQHVHCWGEQQGRT